MNKAVTPSLIDTDLGWPIELVPILIKGKPSAYFNIVRGDNKKILGNCTIKYNVKQNHDFVKETLEHATKNGFRINFPESGIIDRDGKQVFVRFKTNAIYIGNDTVEESITVVHHHDGRNLANQSFCTYTFVDTGLSFNLPMITSQNLKDAACLKCSAEIIRSLRRMAAGKTSVLQINSIIGNLMNPDGKPMSSRKAAAHARLTESIFNLNPSSPWDVFKGIVNYSELIKTSKDRKASMFFGTSAKIVEAAFEMLSNDNS